jgi:hypothetical protein
MVAKGNLKYLTSRIVIPSKLRTSICSVSSKLSCYPAMRQVSEGSVLKYIIDLESPDRFYLIELTSDHIDFSVNSIMSPSYLMKEAVLRLSNLLSIMSDDYESDLRCLLPYINSVIAGDDAIMNHDTSKPFNREAEALLASRVVDLLNQNDLLVQETSNFRSSLISVLAALVVQKYRNDINSKRIANDLKITEDVVCDALTLLKSMGYRMISNRYGGNELVTV